jgi:hypothetical protein
MAREDRERFCECARAADLIDVDGSPAFREIEEAPMAGESLRPCAAPPGVSRVRDERSRVVRRARETLPERRSHTVEVSECREYLSLRGPEASIVGAARETRAQGVSGVPVRTAAEIQPREALVGPGVAGVDGKCLSEVRGCAPGISGARPRVSHFAETRRPFAAARRIA